MREPLTASARGPIALALTGAVPVLGEGSLELPVPSSVVDWLAEILVAGVSA